MSIRDVIFNLYPKVAELCKRSTHHKPHTYTCDFGAMNEKTYVVNAAGHTLVAPNSIQSLPLALKLISLPD